MAVQININQILEGLDEIEVVGTLTISGNYANGVGDALNFNALQGVSSKNGRVFAVNGAVQPDYVSINPVQGYNLEFQLGTNLGNGVMRVFTASGVELGSGAYPGAITGDVNIFFCASFPKLIP
jgi:hypothetical protein